MKSTPSSFGQSAARFSTSPLAATPTRARSWAIVPIALAVLGPVLASFALAAIPGCGGDFDPAARVTDVRVLAVRADAPYAAPGQNVHLEALGVDPADRALTWGFALCINPASANAPSCLQRLDGASVVIQPGKSTFDFTVPADIITSLPSDGASRASVGVAVVACPGELTTSPGNIPFRCVDSASGRSLETHEYVLGVKRVFARDVDKNDNPVIDGITWDGADWPRDETKEVVSCDEAGNDYGACTSKEQHVIHVAVAPSSLQAGTDSFGTPFEEELVVQYYATEGIFEHDVRLATEATTGWVARRASAGRDVKLWFVLRDDRGGVTWDERTIRVAPR